MLGLDRLLLAGAMAMSAAVARGETPANVSGQMPPSPPPAAARVEAAPAPYAAPSLFGPPPQAGAPPVVAAAASGAIAEKVVPPIPAPALSPAAPIAVAAPHAAEPVAPQPALPATVVIPAPAQPASAALPPLPKLPDDTQARVAASQLNIYLYQQLANEAAALKALCETDYGPADLCRKQMAVDPKPAPTVEVETHGKGLSLLQVLGDEHRLAAVLQLAGGGELTVHEGSALPGAGRVVRITPDEVRLALIDGREDTIGFGGESISEAAKPEPTESKTIPAPVGKAGRP